MKVIDRKPLHENERGVVLCRPPAFTSDGLEHAYKMLQPYELRKYLLYWDRMVLPSYFIKPTPEEENRTSWTMDFSDPTSIVAYQTNDDNMFLESCGIIEEKITLLDRNEIERDKRYFLAHQRVTNNLIEESSGWSAERVHESAMMSEGAKPLLQYKINNILPAPMYDTPLNDILEFKEKYRDALVHFRERLDLLYSVVLSSNDPKEAAQKELDALSVEIAGIREGLDMKNIKHIPGSLWNYVSSNHWNIISAAAAGPALADIAGFEIHKVISSATTVGLAVSVDAIRLLRSQQENDPLSYIQLAERNFKF